MCYSLFKNSLFLNCVRILGSTALVQLIFKERSLPTELKNPLYTLAMEDVVVAFNSCFRDKKNEMVGLLFAPIVLKITSFIDIQMVLYIFTILFS